MATLATVQDYVTDARVLLQDTSEPYRYSDANLLKALNMALMDARRIRPDLFLSTFTVQDFSTVDTTAVSIDVQYRTAIVYYMAARMQMTDEEETQDKRADIYMGRFASNLLGLS